MSFYKNIIIIFILVLIINPVSYGKTLKGGVDLNWPLLNQEERTKIINHYHDLLFKDVNYKIDPEKFSAYKKDPYVKENKKSLKNNVRKLKNRELAGFYLFGKILVIYGVKYKDDKYHVYYYDALGRLAYVDILNAPHDEYPHIAYQYKKNGNLAGISYYISDYDQYVFKENGDFKGRWYYTKLYDKRAKVVMTRKLP